MPHDALLATLRSGSEPLAMEEHRLRTTAWFWRKGLGMPSENPLIEAGRTIRAFLPSILDDRAEDFDRRLLVQLRERNVSGVEDVLQSSPKVIDWVGDFTAHGIPPEVALLAERDGGYQAAPGRGIPSPVPRYECPVDHLYVWYRVDPRERVRECPDHPGRLLVRV
ncbi:hypothetical protein [Geodermatophilus sp. CPCC 205761]|uniref:hypothetical protein n=1 Tax=Geodermatophilus sp. CPCC 205761 TaxID=2936597 RepID=UPI003EEC5718